MKKGKVLLCVMVTLLFKITISQPTPTLPTVIPASPTAMQFQRYGDYPVSHYTGLPQISIPLYTVKDGEIELPITLDYHASGSRVNDVRGLVGQGWTLNVGGQVSRTIHGKPDEYFIFKKPALTAENIPYNDAGYRQNELTSIVKYWDSEYDVYSYSYSGKSGKFIIKEDGVPFLFPFKPIEVGAGIVQQGMNAGVHNIIIKDEGGTLYAFGEGDNGGGGSIEYGSFEYDGVTRTPKTTWHLTGIKSSENPSNGINIEYEPLLTYIENGLSYQHIFDDAWDISGDYSTGSVEECHTWVDGFNAFEYSLDNWGRYPTQSTTPITYQTSVPKEIIFSGGKVKFYRNPTTKVLTSVQVYDLNNNLVKKVDVDVLPFPSSYGLNTYSRFKLSSIRIKDVNDTKVEEYTLNYDSETYPNAVPSTYSYSADFWGFYNGQGSYSNYITTMIPRYNGFLYRDDGAPFYRNNIGQANREPFEGYTKAYILNKITYPTGGYTLFDYELNQATYPTLRYGGGLRVKSIASYTDNQLVNKKTYSYNTGIMDIIPDVNDFVYSQYGEMYRSPSPNIWFRRNYFSENSFIDYSPKGSSVVYPSVTETEVGEGGTNGSTMYQYDNGEACSYVTMNYPNASEPSANLPPHFKRFSTNEKPWNYGNLVLKTVTTPNGGYSESYEYEEIIRGTVRDFKLEPFAFPVAPYQKPAACFPPGTFSNSLPFYTSYYDYYSGGNCYYNFADHYFISGENRLKKVTTGYSDGIGGIASTKEYFYDNPTHDQPTSIITSDSKKSEIRTEIKYPHDFASSVTPNIYNEMVDRHIWSVPIEQSTYKNNTFLQLSKSNYNFWYNNAWGTNDPLAKLLPQTVQSKKLSNNLEFRLRFESYDDRGNVRTVYKQDDIKHTYIYGYANQYPVAEVTNADYNTVISFVDPNIINSPSTSDAQMSAELNKIRTGLAPSKALVNTYTFKPLIGMSSQTDANGKSTYFDYDYAGRLQHIRDKDHNILKKYSYSFFDASTATATAPDWQNTTGYCELCQQNPNFVTGVYKQQQIDANPASLTYNQTRWMNGSSLSCVSISPDWSPTGNYRCEQSYSQSTGNQEREDVIVNPCVGGYNQTKRWVNIGANHSTCPIPPFFTSIDMSGYYTMYDCASPDYIGSSEYVSIPAGMFTSTISAQDAVDKASIYGFQQANQLGHCTPVPFDLVFENYTFDNYTIDLIDAQTNSTVASFNASSSRTLGTILPGTYNVNILISGPNNTISHGYGVGCTYFAYDVNPTIYNVTLNSGCNVISANN